MLSEIEAYYDSQSEENKALLLYIRGIILKHHPEMKELWKFRLPFFYLHGKMFCYFHIDKRTRTPYIGFAQGKFLNHPALVLGDRKQIKVYPVSPDLDFNLPEFHEIMVEATAYRLKSI